jgi:hypothetical protein
MKSCFGTYVCDKTCRPRWVIGKGSNKGWRIKLCSKHQIIHETKKIS